MSDSEAKGIALVLVFSLSVTALVSWGITHSYRNNYWQSEAIARGVAGYDEKTGEWKWTVEMEVAE